MARWIVFTDNVFWKYSWAHVVISITVAFLYVMQCRLRARRSRASSMVFQPWPLRTEIVPDSLNLWMILCTVDDDNFKLFFSEKLLSDIAPLFFAAAFGGIGDPLPILTYERHCHSERLFLYPIMLPINLISCKLVLHLFLICTFNLSIRVNLTLIATCPNFFGMCSSHEIQNEPIFGMTFQNVSLSTFDMLSIFYSE